MDPKVCVGKGGTLGMDQKLVLDWTGKWGGVGFRSGTESRDFMLSMSESQELVDILPKMV